MHRFFHSLHIGTLSAWLSVVGFGAVGVSIAPWQPPAPPNAEDTSITTEILPADFLLQQVDPGQGDAAPPAASEEEAPAPLANSIPAPPELEPLAESEPLPDIPDLPPLPPETPDPPMARSSTNSSKPSTSNTSSSTPNRRTSTSPGGRSSSTNSQGGSGSGSGSGSGQSATSRLAAGRMPAPSYPISSKRRGETGSVTVSFTIGTDGKVLSAYVSSPSPHPALNEAAVRAVLRWKFPPGGILKTQRRLDFVLK